LAGKYPKGNLFELSVSFREKVKNSVDIGCVADVAQFKLQIKVFFNAFYLQGKGGAVREMIDNSTDTG